LRFVDIGVHQDGAGAHQRAFQPLHQRAVRSRKNGQIVKVKVLGVDAKAKRIALSIKQLSAPTGRPAAKVRGEAREASLKAAAHHGLKNWLRSR